MSCRSSQSEAAFAVVKALQEKNLLVPVVGDFSYNREALRAVGDYVRAQQATVSAFYLSEVGTVAGPGPVAGPRSARMSQRCL